MTKVSNQKATGSAYDVAKAALDGITGHPWFAWIMYALIAASVWVTKFYLDYLSKRREARIQHKKHIMEYKLNLAKLKKKVDADSTEIQDV